MKCYLASPDEISVFKFVQADGTDLVIAGTFEGKVRFSLLIFKGSLLFGILVVSLISSQEKL